MKIAVIVAVSGQLIGFALLALYDPFNAEGGRDVARALTYGAFLLSWGAVAFGVVLFAIRLIRAIARVGVLQWVASLFSPPGYGVFDDALNEALGLSEPEGVDVVPAADEPVGGGAKWVVVGREPVKDDENRK